MTDEHEQLIDRVAEFAGRTREEVAELFGSQGAPPWEPADPETPARPVEEFAAGGIGATVKSPGKVK